MHYGVKSNHRTQEANTGKLLQKSKPNHWHKFASYDKHSISIILTEQCSLNNTTASQNMIN